jgi:predicted methyltransferase
MKVIVLAAVAAVSLGACATGGAGAGKSAALSKAEEASLDAALAEQAPEIRARYAWRHPKETLTFFGVKQGMTVVDVLPGNDGYYSKILLSYLGPEGRVIGADYAVDMWRLFGSFVNEEFLAKKTTWAADWTETATAWTKGGGASVGAVVYGAIPAEMKGTADIVLMVRALHHFNRFEEEGGWRSKALADTLGLLKPGGVVGVVQHRAPEGHSDKWAEGDNGYLKQSQVIAAFEAAGFEFVGASEVNANAADKPLESENVWRLPPTLGTSRDNPELKAKMQAIGESDRMTLKFRKPT